MNNTVSLTICRSGKVGAARNLRLPGEINTTITSRKLLPITLARPSKPSVRWLSIKQQCGSLATDIKAVIKSYLSRRDGYYVFTRMLSSVSRFVIILWIFRAVGCPRGENPSEHKRGIADGEFRNNTILSPR